ncbi:hypothetical protein CSUB8523_0689 [Campylobacter subantarcticus LMG 24377]|uniref:Uncharacterized protein n=1 Tax=Campylobacter subantarcticus TaxID=497724 RepID=A0ABW9N4X9_9BACT|nr:hypothetical protein [Campylobacter subantarcticus]AJC92213.1 hypothetical protein CSUB8523_0689 [Campylobacter subantarcticus LMG 24377]EAL3938360.1 hypothetical protein [Campylobacter lari]MPB99289.1 hypothetical protein [Campylobacter subantarcticus]
MIRKQFNEIKERLTKYREIRHLTYENQQAEFLGNAFEKVSEYFRAKNDLERIDALCDIAVFCFNAFDFTYKMLKDYEPRFYTITSANIAYITRCVSDFICYDDDSKIDISKYNLTAIILYLEQTCKKLGFDFYKCMIETIKEIESRTGYYDNELKKFVKDTSDEAKSKWYKADYEGCKLQ